MTKLLLTDIRPGDVLLPDDGFDCMAESAEKIVRADHDGLYVYCRQGKHYLAGQCDDFNVLIGLRAKPAEAAA